MSNKLMGGQSSSGKTHKLIVVEDRKRGKYRGEVNGVKIPLSHQPFLAAARKLLELGADPTDALEMWRIGNQTWTLRSTIGAASKLGVENDRFVKWRTPPSQQNRKEVVG